MIDLHAEMKRLEDPRYGSFYDNLPTEELARRQGIVPLSDADSLAWPFGPEDWEGFEEVVQEWRHATPNIPPFHA